MSVDVLTTRIAERGQERRKENEKKGREKLSETSQAQADR
jgi:hypothetical protein